MVDRLDGDRVVAFGLERRELSRAEIARKVNAALDLVGLSAYAGRRMARSRER